MVKVAVAVEEKDENALVSERAGRASYYMVFEVENEAKLVETLENPFKMGSGGAGYSVAKMLADKGIDVIVAGRFGPNMEMAMNERKVKYKVAAGPAKQAALEAVK